MNYLIDVNVLVALGWADHAHYERTGRWVFQLHPTDRLLTSPITQMGFVRVSVQRSGGEYSPEDVGLRLKNLVSSLREKHQFLTDDQSCFHWPAWCHTASRTTDAHLLALAKAHGAELATLDTRIPGAFVIP